MPETRVCAEMILLDWQGVGGVRGAARAGDLDEGWGALWGRGVIRVETSLCQTPQELELLYWLPLLVYRDKLQNREN